MNLLIDSKLCATPDRIAIEDDPELPDRERVVAIVVQADDSIPLQLRRRSSRRAYRSAPCIEGGEPIVLQLAPLVHADLR